MKKTKEIDDPPIPDEKNTKPPVVRGGDARHLQEVHGGDRLVRRAHQERPRPRPQVRGGGHRAALPRLADRARAPVGQIAEQYCGTKSDVGFKAYDAILQTYFIDFSVQDEEQKDCALGKLLTVAEQFGESACGKAPAAKPYLDRIAQIKSSVKTTIITKRLQLSMENEEKGTDKELVMCQRGRAASRWSPALPRRRPRRARSQATTGQGKISTQLDVGLALDLIDVVNANPKDPGAPTALNNACVIYEKLFQFGEATKCYERLYSRLPRLGVGQGSALERLAQPLPVLRVRPGGQGLHDRRAGSEVRAVGAPQGGARARGVAARQRPAVHARRGPLQEVLGRHGRQAAGQRAGLLLRLQRLREGERRRPSRSPASRTSSRSSTSSRRPASTSCRRS